MERTSTPKTSRKLFLPPQPRLNAPLCSLSRHTHILKNMLVSRKSQRFRSNNRLLRDKSYYHYYKLLKKVQTPARQGREFVRSLQAEIAQEGQVVSLGQTVSVAGPFAKVGVLTAKAASLCDQCRSGCSRKAGPGAIFNLRLQPRGNCKPIQRILQLKNWQVCKRLQGFQSRARSRPTAASRPDERGATDLTCAWCGKDRLADLAVIIDCCAREILGWLLLDNGSIKAAEAALEVALIYRLGALGRAHSPRTLRSDNGLDLSS